jgi:glycosyltransferase involved in cell wall biosynthesis
VRPSVDVVVPFAGAESELDALRRRLASVRLRDEDTLTIVDNLPRETPPPEGVVRAAAERSSYHARNVGAAAGGNPWICFLDADVQPKPDLLDSYLESPPDERTACVVGGLRDEQPGPGASVAVQYAHRKGHMTDDSTAYPRTANCLVRRQAFDEVGGFAEGIRSGGDADLWLRLKEAGWRLERRPKAAAVHLNRGTLRSLARQIVRHGAGSAWVESRHPGTFPRRSRLGLARWSAGRFGRAAAALVRGRREEGVDTALEGLLIWADELGRLLPNRPPRS